ncbi:ATP-binding protein [Paraglaciecola sp. 25GB23A]|uniref:sensor histidine kinase n=1 Tax=Paraglaciecola sp. 25GB23A TaxID=3156068 RepID=UPI0032AF8413
MQRIKWLENTTITWVLISVITFSVIVGNAVLASNIINKLSATQNSLLNAGNVLNALNNLHVLILSAETGQRGYLLTEDVQYLAPYTEALDDLSEQLDTVARIKSELPAQKARIDTLLNLTREKMQDLTATVDLALDDEEKQALKRMLTGRGHNIYQSIDQQFAAIQKAEELFSLSLFANLASAQSEARVTFIISAITSSLLLVGMVFLAIINIRIERQNRERLEYQNEVLADKVQARTTELKLYSEELKRSNRELEDFAFVASHDLQEPLRKIRAFGDRLRSNYAQRLDEKGDDYINRMHNAAERMSDLINDLLEFSRINTRGKDFVKVDLNDTVATIIDDLEIAIKESDAQISLCTLPIIDADPSQMYQLLLNLISNAVKFKKAGGAVQISFSYQLVDATAGQHHISEKWHLITITDNGIGFAQEYADKIFSPFQRLHSRDEYKGTGIGLAVCRRIVERHHGQISAQSAEGLGAQFSIRLPEQLSPLTLDRDQRNAL